MVFRMFAELCKHHHNFRTFLWPQKETVYPSILLPLFQAHCRQPLRYFLSYGFAYSGHFL